MIGWSRRVSDWMEGKSEIGWSRRVSDWMEEKSE